MGLYFRRMEGLSLDFVKLPVIKLRKFRFQIINKLPIVQFAHQNLIIIGEYLLRILWQRIDIIEMCESDIRFTNFNQFGNGCIKRSMSAALSNDK